MARRQAAINKVTIHDNISDSAITLYYRMPTTRERQDYQNMAVSRRGNKLDFKQAEARLKFGMKIIEGFDVGDFERLDESGNYVPIASNPALLSYYPEWKTFVEENGADLVMLLAGHVFDASAALQPEEDVEGK